MKELSLQSARAISNGEVDKVKSAMQSRPTLFQETDLEADHSACSRSSPPFVRSQSCSNGNSCRPVLPPWDDTLDSDCLCAPEYADAPLLLMVCGPTHFEASMSAAAMLLSMRSSIEKCD